MSTGILIMGESGAGKSTSLRTLDPKKTYYIDADKKGLSWKGWNKQYCVENNNYIRTSEASKIGDAMKYVNNSCPEIDVLIVDTINAIMIDDEMRRMNEKTYDKWQDMAVSIYGLVSATNVLRQDLFVICMAHVQDNLDENGNHFYHILTGGKKLEKIKLESKFTTVLFSKGNNGKYIFETQSKNSTAKSPLGLFETFEIQNDLQFVIDQYKNFLS
jgi:hypothetical protein